MTPRAARRVGYRWLVALPARRRRRFGGGGSRCGARGAVRLPDGDDRHLRGLMPRTARPVWRSSNGWCRIVEATEAELSTWRGDSVLGRLNRHPVGEAMPAPVAVCELLEHLATWGEALGGARSIP